MRKTILQYECCKTMLASNIFCRMIIKLWQKKQYRILCTDSAITRKAENRAPGSRSLTLVRAHKCTQLSLITQEIIKLIRGSSPLKLYAYPCSEAGRTPLKGGMGHLAIFTVMKGF